jgi:hypothetical protein
MWTSWTDSWVVSMFRPSIEQVFGVLWFVDENEIVEEWELGGQRRSIRLMFMVMMKKKRERLINEMQDGGRSDRGSRLVASTVSLRLGVDDN